MIRAARAALAAAALWLPAAARAHSPFPGLEGLYVGFVHPLTQPAQVMLLLALGLFVASRSGAARGPTAAAVGLGAIGGLLLGTLTGPQPDPGPLLAGAVIAGGAGIFLPAALPAAVSLGFVALCGMLLGFACVPDPGAWRDVLITSTGSWLGLAYFAVLAMGGCVALLERWPGPVVRVGVQVAAAWLMAAAAMYAAFLWFAPGGS